MTSIDSFRVIPQTPPDRNDPYRSPRAAVQRDGHDVGLTLKGAKLEAQFAVAPDSYLLLLSDDCPYEETLRAYLLDRSFTVVDSAQLSYAYTPGSLRRVQIASENALEFLFTGDGLYRLTIHAKPRHLWNISGGVAEVIRFLSRRRIEISREQ